MIKDSLGFQLDARKRIGSHTRIGKSPTNSLEHTLKKTGHICQDKALAKWYPLKAGLNSMSRRQGGRGTQLCRVRDPGASRH